MKSNDSSQARKRRRLVTSDEATLAPKQLVKPCSDCPFSRDSAGAWLGSLGVEEWLEVAHGEVRVPCHVHSNVECAGIAVYRANVCKMPRDQTILKLPPDHESVFSSKAEFATHHSKASL